MPVHSNPDGTFSWGTGTRHGKFKSRKAAERQAAAAFSHGYTGKADVHGPHGPTPTNRYTPDLTGVQEPPHYLGHGYSLRRIASTSPTMHRYRVHAPDSSLVGEVTHVVTPKKNLSMASTADGRVHHQSYHTPEHAFAALAHEHRTTSMNKAPTAPAQPAQQLDKHKPTGAVHVFPGAGMAHHLRSAQKQKLNQKGNYGPNQAPGHKSKKSAAILKALDATIHLATQLTSYDPTTSAAYKAVVASLMKQDGWTPRSHRKFWRHISKPDDHDSRLNKGPHTVCAEKMQGRVDDPHAFCAWSEHQATKHWPGERRDKEDKAFPPRAPRLPKPQQQGELVNHLSRRHGLAPGSTPHTGAQSSTHSRSALHEHLHSSAPPRVADHSHFTTGTNKADPQLSFEDWVEQEAREPEHSTTAKSLDAVISLADSVAGTNHEETNPAPPSRRLATTTSGSTTPAPGRYASFEDMTDTLMRIAGAC